MCFNGRPRRIESSSCSLGVGFHLGGGNFLSDACKNNQHVKYKLSAGKSINWVKINTFYYTINDKFQKLIFSSAKQFRSSCAILTVILNVEQGTYYNGSELEERLLTCTQV